MTALPRTIDWQLTYACQLRCTHCYTESGRRASRKLGRAQLLQIADTLVQMQVERVLLVGGEPLLVPELFEIIERLRAGGIPVSCYTNGLDLTTADAIAFAERGAAVHVSLDGATAEVNDAIRGRPGAFAATMASLHRLDAVAATRPLRYGIDAVLVRSNFHQLRQICGDLMAGLPHAAYLSVAAVIPIGLASEPAFRNELLTADQLRSLGQPELLAELHALVPPHIELTVFDNQELQIYSRFAAMTDTYRYLMEIEPDGAIRGFAACEGTIGNILVDAPEVLWARCKERVGDPAIVDRLTAAQTAEQWAQAIYEIDRQFAAKDALVRLSKRAKVSA
jgi:MoaA/NifB/PqqE/SkfB family radical SAM enzyme